MSIDSNFLRVSLIISVIFLISACGKQDDSQPIEPSVEAIAAELPSMPVGEKAVSVVEVKLQGGDISSPVFLGLREDRETTTSKSHNPVRRILLEAGPGTVDEILQQTRSSIRAAGYRPGKVVEERGGLRQNFRKDGVDLVRVLVRPRGEGPELRDPTAMASIYISETGSE